MDRLTRAFYDLSFRNCFLLAKGDAFQDLFSSIMEKRYPRDFSRVRPWGRHGDRKNDGYLGSRRQLFQCYAPNKMNVKKCVAKIEEDFTGALPYWKEHFDEWVFVHNSSAGLGPVQLAKLLALRKAHAPLRVTSWGYEELRREVDLLELPELVSLFGHAPSQRDVIELRIEPLVQVLDHIAESTAPASPDVRPVPADKLARNLLSDAVAVLLRAGMTRTDLIPKYFRDRPTSRDRVAETLRQKYAELRGAELPPDQIFAGLQELATGSAPPTPSIHVAVLTVLAFFFEECDIFERPDPEDHA